MNGMTQNTLVLDAQAAGAPLEPYWKRNICGDRAGLGLRADFRACLATAVRECGFETLRQHGLFHDDMFVWFKKDQPFNFQYIFSNFDFYLSLGIRPFVELSFLPRWMASDDKTVFAVQCPACPPADYRDWHRLVHTTVKALVDRYGVEEVRGWHFECWNEPNIPFWSGTQEQYFELYRVSAEAVKSVDAALRIGGPATANYGRRPDKGDRFWPCWVEEFMAFCDRERLPVDFISTHPYPTDFPFDNAAQAHVPHMRERDATVTDLTLLRQLVDAGPFPDAEIHCNEWGTSPGGRDFVHEHPFSATFHCENLLRCVNRVDSLGRWVFCDVSEERPPGPAEFHGGWGLLTVHGIKKPDFHAYAFLNRLGGALLHNGDGVAVARGAGAWQVLLYNHHHYLNGDTCDFADPDAVERLIGMGETRTFRLQLDNLPRRVRLTRRRVDREHGWAMPHWRAMGSPAWPTPAQLECLYERMEPAVTRETALLPDGLLKLTENLPPLGMLLIEIDKT